MNAVAEVSPVSVTVPSNFVNPLSIDAAADKLDNLLSAMVDSAVGTINDEIRRMIRQREVAAAVRGIRRTKNHLDAMREQDNGLGVFNLSVLAQRPDLVDMFRVINPTAADVDVATVVDSFLGQYAEETKKRRKGKQSDG